MTLLHSEVAPYRITDAGPPNKGSSQGQPSQGYPHVRTHGVLIMEPPPDGIDALRFQVRGAVLNGFTALGIPVTKVAG